MLRLDEHIDDWVTLAAVDPLNRRERQWPPERHPQHERRRRRSIAGQANMEPTKPKGRTEQFEGSEHIPGQRLPKSVTAYSAQPCGRPPESIRMMWNDDELLPQIFQAVCSQQLEGTHRQFASVHREKGRTLHTTK
jgi:hypothetical protein